MYIYLVLFGIAFGTVRFGLGRLNTVGVVLRFFGQLSATRQFEQIRFGITIFEVMCDEFIQDIGGSCGPDSGSATHIISSAA